MCIHIYAVDKDDKRGRILSILLSLTSLNTATIIILDSGLPWLSQPHLPKIVQIIYFHICLSVIALVPWKGIYLIAVAVNHYKILLLLPIYKSEETNLISLYPNVVKKFMNRGNLCKCK